MAEDTISAGWNSESEVLLLGNVIYSETFR